MSQATQNYIGLTIDILFMGVLFVGTLTATAASLGVFE